MNGLEKITGRILDDANACRDELTGRAAAEADAIRAEYGEKAKALLEAEESAAKKEAEALIARAAASGETQKRNVLLGAKGKAVDRAFELARQQLAALPDEDALALLSALCGKMIGESIADEQASADRIASGEIVPCTVYEIAMNAHDSAKFGDRLLAGMNQKAAEAGKTLRLASPVSIDGGIVLRTGDIENNCSFSRLLEQVRREEEGKILSILFPAAN